MGSGHDHGTGANAKMLKIALAITASFMLVEFAAGFYFNSLALLSDAGHMLTDVTALSIALLAISVGLRPADDKRSFGYRRFEILAATFNAMMLFAIAIYIMFEAYKRFSEPQEVQSWGMLIIASLGLIVNLVAMHILEAGKDKSMNVKGAYLEVWADMIGSVGVIIGALIIKFTSWSWVDSVVAVLIGIWVLPRTWILLRDTINILLEGVSSEFDMKEVRAEILRVGGVAGLHDLHIWSISNDAVNATVHIIVEEGQDHVNIRQSVSSLFSEHFDISHVTVQTEDPSALCEDLDKLHP